MVTRNRKIMVWVLWAALWPAILWLAYEFYYINIDGHLVDIFLFALFMGLVAWFPLIINNNPIFLVNGISIAVFLTFGLFAEILLTQIAIIVVLLKVGIRKKDSFRYPLNMLLFSLVSILAAELFILLGGTHDMGRIESGVQFLAIAGYAVTIFILNHILTKLTDKIVYQRKVKFFDEGLRWELTSSLLIIPVGFVLYVLYMEIGRAGIFYLGIPFVFISVIFMLLYSSKEINRYLEKTGIIGHQLTKRMVLDDVYDIFIDELSDLMPINYAYIYMVNGNKLQLEKFRDIHKSTEAEFESLERNEAFSGKVWASGKPIMYNQADEWQDVKSGKIPNSTESVLSIPVEYGENIIGVVTVESRKKKAFEKLHFQILDILTNYLGVASENARNYERTKAESEKDQLTQLYNFRYLENQIDTYYNSLRLTGSQMEFSLLLLDLDHFKKVNDTYGHEAGNEILCQVAERLTVLVGDKGIPARYGGEEFVIFLPESGLNEATIIAEKIRSGIANKPFTVRKHIFDIDEPLDVLVTLSLGLAVYPLHCETPEELVRHADRAMYIGAKRMGRNRVAVYEDLKTS
ncbi:diguanylate cyclase [Virgibacillus kekensis]|uniref:Diguanylate cyclase n=1 Tax=Virgibacillus kekensis TaxID=202261 RepID=A0ABV9DJN4_9BACI